MAVTRASVLFVSALAAPLPGAFNVRTPDRHQIDIAKHWDVVAQVLATNASASLPWPPRTSTHRLTMSDGVGLDTILINPHPYDEPKCTAMVRSPYGPTSENIADFFVATNGCAAVLQDDRGTFLSGGSFDFWKGAASDSRDTMDWISQQPWSNGDVFTAGASADGINEAVEIMGPSPHLKGQWWMWTTANGHDFAFPGGVYRRDLTEGYFTFMGPELHFKGKEIRKEVKKNEAFGPWWKNVTICPDDKIADVSDPDCHWANVKWPVMLQTGWNDIFQHTSINAWNALRKSSDPAVRDLHVHNIGPLGHCLIALGDAPLTGDHPLANGEMQSITVSQEIAAEMFRGDFAGPARSRVGRLNLFVMGDSANQKTTGDWNYWTSLDDWPKATETLLHLNAGSTLTPSQPQSPGVVTYAYDPADPAPMIGGNNLPIPVFSKVKGCGSEDQSEREARDDVIWFDSEPLAEDLVVVGNIKAKIFVSSSAKDTDFVVTVSDLSSAGSYLVRYGAQRMRWRDSSKDQSEALVTGSIYEIDIDMHHTAYVFPKGHSVRVSVSSAAYPYFSANSNSGKMDLMEDVDVVVAHNAISFSKDLPSHVSLPVVLKSLVAPNYNFTGKESSTLLV